MPREQREAGEARFRLLADSAPVMIWRSDTTMGCDWFNQPWLDYTGRALEQELGFGWADGVHPLDAPACLEIYTRAFERREAFSMTYRLRDRDGGYRWLLDNGRPYFGENGSFSGYLGSCVNVDQLVREKASLSLAAQERADVIAQRDLLLHEVQHRVRNNLQLILSIIDMQARICPPETRKPLELIAGRVRSIAKAQAMVSDPAEGPDIDLSEYIVSLAQAAAGQSQRGEIVVRARTDPIRMHLARAVPLGLMINEIIAACVEHGADDGEGDVIRLAIRSQDDGISIEIATGAAGDLVDEALKTGRALSHRLIERLAAQAGARVENNSDGAARYSVHVAP
jgi:two-component system, sensor histidine kinase PdtaS